MQVDRGTQLSYRPARRRARAVTLVELLVVTALVAVVATIVVASSMNTATLRADEVACRIQGDLGYAQSQAILLRKPMCLVCDTTQGLYYLARAATPTTPIVNPLSKKDYRILFRKACNTASMNSVPRIEAYSDADLVTASFDGTGTVTYNALGLPLGSGGSSLVSGKIEIAVSQEKLTVVIDPTTGAASIQVSAGNQQQQQGSPQQQQQQQDGLLSWLLGGLGL